VEAVRDALGDLWGQVADEWPDPLLGCLLVAVVYLAVVIGVPCAIVYG
jgi:hypothetical protein